MCAVKLYRYDTCISYMPILCESRVYSRNSIPVRIIILQGTVHWVAFQIPLTSIKGTCINTTGKWTLDLLLVTVEILKKDWKSDLWNVNVQGTHMKLFVIHASVHAVRHDITCVWHCHHEESAAISMTKTGILPSCVHVKSFMCTLYIYIPKIATNTVHDTTCTMVYGCQFIHPIYMYTTITYIQTCVHDIINYWSVYYLGDHFWYL